MLGFDGSVVDSLASSHKQLSLKNQWIHQCGNEGEQQQQIQLAGSVSPLSSTMAMELACRQEDTKGGKEALMIGGSPADQAAVAYTLLQPCMQVRGWNNGEGHRATQIMGAGILSPNIFLFKCSLKTKKKALRGILKFTLLSTPVKKTSLNIKPDIHTILQAKPI